MTQEDMVPPELRRNVFIAPVDWIYNLGRAASVWPVMFGLACCAFEMIVSVTSRFDLARFGMEFLRASPRQSELMIVSGTVTKKMAPQVVRLYDQMPEPKYVLAMGACAISGGPFKDGYNVVPGVDKYLPVNVYVPGCPPRPESLIDGIIKLHKQIREETILTSPWYRKDVSREFPVPEYGARGLVLPKGEES
ncbi:MAG: NADH-quinone oxidoreductase subunit B [Anaerolineae bacterium]|nr:NADH-quinone oxidoreductase subunit B [Anaerolineae bacterium]